MGVGRACDDGGVCASKAAASMQNMHNLLAKFLYMGLLAAKMCAGVACESLLAFEEPAEKLICKLVIFVI